MTVAATPDPDLVSELPPEPYPGLRPFEPSEWAIFFGREPMIDEVIARLARQHLVIVHGASGCGKSSLVRAGVLPWLNLDHARSDKAWATAIVRPSGGPLRNIARALAEKLGPPPSADSSSAQAGSFWHNRLALGSSADSEISQALEAKGTSLCLLIDQFEELFRYAKETSREEAQLLIDLLEAVANPGHATPRLFVILTMRSDYLGECARFKGFAETVNCCQYLLPQLDDFALVRAIHEPAALYGGKIDPAVGDRLIFAARKQDDDALPILQHALMRACARAREHHGLDGWTVTLSDLQDIEGKHGALSQHADEILAEVAAAHSSCKAAQWLFRSLSEFDAEGRVIRRPRRLGDLVEVAGGDRAGILAAIEAFRAPGRSFLTASPSGTLNDETEIDVSHEAFIRGWRQLSDPSRDAKLNQPVGWLWREFEDGQRWRALAVQARVFREDKSRRATLSPATTEAYESWWPEHTAAWAARYARDKERAEDEYREVEALWEASKKAQQAEREAKAAEEAARLRALKIRAGFVFLIGAIIAAGFSLYLGITKDHEAKRAAQAEAAEREFRSSMFGLASKVAREPPKAVGAGDALAIALAKPEAYPDRFDYLQDVYRALGELREKRRIVEVPGQVFSVAFVPGKSLISVLIPGQPLLQFWQDDGVLLDSFSVDAGPWATLRWSPDGERLLIGSSTGARLLTPCSRSKLRMHFRSCDEKSEDVILRLGSTENPAGQGVWSPDGKLILTGGLRSPAKLWNASSGAFEKVWVSRDNEFAADLGRVVNSEPGTGVAFSFDNEKIAVGAPNGEIAIINAKTLKREKTLRPGPKHQIASTFSLAFNPKNSNMLVSTSQNALARLWDVSAGTEIPLEHHRGAVYQGIFGPEGDFLATASEDGAIWLWLLDRDRVRGPIMLRGHQGTAFSVDVARDGTIVSGSSDKTVRLWNQRSPLSPIRASQHLPPLNRRGYEVTTRGSKVVVKRGGVVKYEAEWSAEQGNPAAASMTANGEFIVIVPESGRPLLFTSGNTGSYLAMLRRQDEWREVSFLESEGQIAALNSQGEVYVWPFYPDFGALKRKAKDSLPLQGTERIKVPDHLMCALISRVGNCPVMVESPE